MAAVVSRPLFIFQTVRNSLINEMPIELNL
jgi:hypothetical protein